MITVDVLVYVQIGVILLLIIFWFFTKYTTNIKIQIADLNSVKMRKSRDGHKLSFFVLWVRAFLSDSNMTQIGFHLIFAILSFWETGFIGFHLLLVFNLTETMKTVLKGFTTHFD